MRHLGSIIFSGLLLMCCLLASQPAQAAFEVGITGDAVQLVTPVVPGAVRGELVSNNYNVWYESTNVLESDLTVDHKGQAGTFKATEVADLGGDIQAGTKIDSYFVHLELPKLAHTCCCYGMNTGGGQVVSATITFANAILGIDLFEASLNDTDSLGAPGTSYATDDKYRGLGKGDTFGVSEDGKTLTLDLKRLDKRDFDQMRVFTAGSGFGGPGSGVPEPSSMAIWSVMAMLPVAKRYLRRGQV